MEAATSALVEMGFEADQASAMLLAAQHETGRVGDIETALRWLTAPPPPPPSTLPPTSSSVDGPEESPEELPEESPEDLTADEPADPSPVAAPEPGFGAAPEPGFGAGSGAGAGAGSGAGAGAGVSVGVDYGYDAYDQDNEYATDEEEEYVYESDEEEGVVTTADIPPEPAPLRRQVSTDAILTPEELRDELVGELARVTDTFSVSLTVAAALLKHFQWDYAPMAAAYAENPDRVLAAAGISAEELESSSAVAQLPAEIEPFCMICIEDGLTRDDMLMLRCGHVFCKTCWKDHISAKVTGGEAVGITCMEVGCPQLLGGDMVRRLCPKAVYKKWLAFFVRAFVDGHPYIRWCPRTRCNLAIRTSSRNKKLVTCACGKKFCFICLKEAHAPATCDQLRAWKRKLEGDSATGAWIVANTKDCPKCRTPIEKNGGCQHMTCSKCHHGFCWFCLGDWRGHRACNRLDRTAALKARSSLQVFLHYSTRFEGHELFQRNEKKLRKQTTKKIRTILKTGADGTSIADPSTAADGLWTSSDMDYVNRALDVLFECRRVLKWSYCFAWTMPPTPEKDFFEFLQRELEGTTDKLSGELERSSSSIFARRFEINQVVANAQKRLDGLLDGAENGFRTGASAGSVPPPPSGPPASIGRTESEVRHRMALDKATTASAAALAADEERQLKRAMEESALDAIGDT